MWLIKVLYIHFAPTLSYSFWEKRNCFSFIYLFFCSACLERKIEPNLRCWRIHSLFECVTSFVFVMFVPAFLPAWHRSSPHLTEFAHADPIRYNLLISAPLCWNLLFLHLTFLKKHAALALSSCASHNTFTCWCWCVAFKESLGSVSLFIHLQSHAVPGCVQAKVFGVFLFFLFSKGFMVLLEAMINLDKCDLGKALQSDASIAGIIYLKTNTSQNAGCFFSVVALISLQLIKRLLRKSWG